ncbi:MAG: hypothetical protein FWD17_01675 [Polyangiaceae bacterium]|nr:hypothetical protein [Polyangiaceae bacterium]
MSRPLPSQVTPTSSPALLPAKPPALALGATLETALAALVDHRVDERFRELAARPEYVNQRTVAAVCGMLPRDYLWHCREGDWPAFADRRLRYSKTADVIRWIAAHPTSAPKATDAQPSAHVRGSRSVRRIA